MGGNLSVENLDMFRKRLQLCSHVLNPTITNNAPFCPARIASSCGTWPLTR